ncbi:type I secretion C-terminal target domain (VC_A0849 subclass), partial [Rhizobium sp. RU33A]|uniref:Ig-like domain-containing protein n=1 Tax=Rhizobium sp. RU33A TaxID=1907413 RepID=UPI0009562C64
ALAGGIVTFTPTANFSGQASFTYTLDNGAATDTGTVTIDVAPVAAPAIISLSAAVATAQVQVTNVIASEAPAVAALSGGGHVVVWYDANNLHYATYDAAGTPGASGVLSGGPYYDRGHSVVALDNNGFAIIGNTNDSRPASLHSFASPGGTATVTQIASGEFLNSAMTRLANGDIAFAIEYGSSNRDIRIGIITPGASAPSALVNALSNQAGNQENPDIAALPGGGFVVAWSTGAAIQVQRYGPDGTREGAVITSLPVSDTLLSFVPSIAVLVDGSYVVAFYSSGADREVYQLRYGVDGQPLGEPSGTPVRVNSTTTDDQTLAEVVALPDGGYVIVWHSSNPAAPGIYGQRFDADGVPLGAEFQVADGFASFWPIYVDGAATLTSDGDLLVAYQSNTNSGTISFARVEIASLGSEDAGPISLPVAVTVEPGDTIQSITVTGVPAGAVLTDGVRSATSTGASVDLTGWTLSTLTFTPPANASGTFTLTLSVTTTDTATLSGSAVTDTETVTRSFEVTVIAVNDAPTLTGLNGVTFLENTVNAAPQIIDADVVFADIDSANLDTGKLTVSGFIVGQDTIGIRNQGAGANQIGVSGTNVTYGGVVIGTVTGGSGANNLVVSFNADATPVAVDALIQNLTYANSSGTPTATRTLTISVTDGDGGTVLATSVVNVTAENDAPTLTGDFAATMANGATYVLDVADLDFIDVDDSATGVVFSVSNLVNGTVWVAGSQANSFTGVQLAGGSVEFRHNGSATTSASFNVSVEDGNEDGSVPVAQAFSITVTPPAQVAVADHLSFASEYWRVWEVNGHAYYTAIPGLGQTPFAHVDTLLGGAAYVATITSAGESAFVLANARHNFYSVIGGSDSAVEGVWRWIEGPESGTQFWSGAANGTAVGGAYAPWASNEPNNGGGGEDYVILVSEAGANYGKWVDVGARTGEDGRYIAEAGTVGSLYVANQASGQTSFLANILLQNDTGAAAFSSVSATSTLGASLAYDAATGRITYNAGSILQVQALATGQTLDDTFTYQLSNGSTGTVTMTIQGVDDAPTLTGFDNVTFLENTVNAAPQVIDANVVFADVDSANLDTYTLRVSGFINGEDTIGIRNQGTGAGQIGFSGGNVTYGGTVIGSFFGGSGPNNLVVTFNANATPTAVDALLQNLTYANSRDTPTATRTLTISVTDGYGGGVSATSVVNVTAQSDVTLAVASADVISPAPVGWTWLATNGHIYKYVSTDTTWSNAVTSAAGEITGQSYLATSTSSAEDALIDSLATGRTHLGATDQAAEGTWKWVTGPEAGQVFWIGGANGSAQNGAFTNWSSNNPGNLSGYNSAENYLATDVSKNWNDVDASNSNVGAIGYTAEAGGLNGQTYATITEDAPFTFSQSWLLANDSNAPAAIQSVSATSSKGAAVSYNSTTGEITYNPTGSSTLQALRTGQTTTDTFTYTISDGNGGTSTATVTVNVQGISTAPVVSNLKVTATTIGFTITDADSGSIAITPLNAAEALGTSFGIGQHTVNMTAGTSDTTVPVNFTDGVGGSFTPFSLGRGTNGWDTIEAYNLPTGAIVFGFGGVDGIIGTGMNDYLIGGADRDTITGGLGSDRFIYTAGDTAYALASSGGNNGSVSGFDRITDFDPGVDKLDFAVAPQVATVNGPIVDGAVSFLRYVNGAGNEVGAHRILSGGIIQFSDSASPFSPLTLNSGQAIAAAVDYLGRNDLGAAGTLVSFSATLGGVNYTYVYQQVGDTPNAVNDILIELEGVAGLSNLATVLAAAMDPIVLDLNGDGLHFTGASFDLDHDGVADSIAWPSGGDGLLVVDLDGSGAIESGNEVFSPDFNGGGFETSLDALASLDANGDGRIDMQDAYFGDIRLWIDADGNGISDADELVGLADAGVAAVRLDALATSYIVDGQRVFAEGQFELVDGSTGEFFGLDLGPFDGTGDRFLSGEVGDDILNGLLARDTLTGAPGMDTFVFDVDVLAASGLGIRDLIADYDFGGGDVIDFAALLGSQQVNQVDANGSVNGALLEGDIGGMGTDADGTQIIPFSPAPFTSALHILVEDDVTPSSVAI